MICGCGRPPCVKRGTTNDGVVRKGVIDDKEIDLLGELLKVRPNGYQQGDGSHGEDLDTTEPY